MLSIFVTEERAKIVEQNHDAKLLFYFYDHRDEKCNTAVAILRGLLFQFTTERPQLIKHALPDFDTQARAQQVIRENC
jgi:hypothetical protein